MKNNNIQRSLFRESEKSDLFFFENQKREKGFIHIAGIDEAGRGPLAGPVVAAAVILKYNDIIEGLTDSKKVSPPKRELLFHEITKRAISLGVGIACHKEVDEINILQATLLAMKRAVEKLSTKPQFLLIDGITPLPINIPQETIKKGDSRSYSIAAASILAKVTRDHIMIEQDKIYPEYGFMSHKGYGSQKHRDAIKKYSPCPIHRKTFAGVKEHVR